MRTRQKQRINTPGDNKTTDMGLTKTRNGIGNGTWNGMEQVMEQEMVFEQNTEWNENGTNGTWMEIEQNISYHRNRLEQRTGMEHR